MFPSKVIRKEDAAERTVALYFERPEKYQFEAGQYASVSFPYLKDSEDKREYKHTFSISSSPDADHLRFITRVRDTSFKKRLYELEVGAEVEIGMPGGFSIAPGFGSDKKIMFVIGGIGITPVLSYLESATENSPSAKLLWSNKNSQTTPYYEQFVSGKYSQLPRFEVVFAMTRSDEGKYEGRIDAEVLKAEIDLAVDELYIYGSEDFVDDISSHLVAIDFEWGKIKTESFAGY